jgi:hypothetical protein
MFHITAPGARRIIAAFIFVACSAVGAAAQPFPVGWSSVDVGDVGQPGHSSETGGVWSVNGAGGDIWGTDDAFHFAFTRVDNDVDIYALLESEQPTHPFAKAGLMIRQHPGASADHVLIDVKPGGGIEVLTRRIRFRFCRVSFGLPGAGIFL